MRWLYIKSRTAGGKPNLTFGLREVAGFDWMKEMRDPAD